jgi:hypothetical protein
MAPARGCRPAAGCRTSRILRHPWFAPFPCAGPCPRSSLASQMSSRPCGRAVRRTSDRARARTRRSERSRVMRVRTGSCCRSAARTQPVAPFGRIGERDVQAGRAAARVDLLADDAEDRRDYVHVAHAEALDRRTERRAIRGRRATCLDPSGCRLRAAQCRTIVLCASAMPCDHPPPQPDAVATPTLNITLPVISVRRTSYYIE